MKRNFDEGNKKHYIGSIKGLLLHGAGRRSPFLGAFAFIEGVFMDTIIYIDGMSLYHGCLQGTPYKWLDLKKLFRSMLKPKNKIVEVKYFCAPLLPNKNGDTTHPENQQVYFDALKASGVDITLGHFLEKPNGEREEKCTDVNLSIHMLNDAWKKRYVCAVLVSNDNDMSEPLSLIKRQWPEKRMLLFSTAPKKNPIAGKLRKHADYITRIKPKDLAAAQFPNVVHGIHKPKGW